MNPTESNARIGINMCPFSSSEGGGIIHYGLSLFRELADLVPERVRIFYCDRGVPLLSPTLNAPHLKKIKLDGARGMLEHKKAMDVLLNPFPWPDITIPDLPLVNFLPDIQEQYYPKFFSQAALTNRGIYYGHSARASTILIVPSHYTKKTIVEKFHVAPEKIAVIYHGAHPMFSDASEPGVKPATLREDLHGYLFYPSNPWFHKNHTALLDALALLNAEHGRTVPCVFTGHLMEHTPGYVDLPAEIARRDLGDQVFHLGRVSLKELKYLYLNAAALVLPSLFEGFGIPLVEAMATGCPIVASDRTSIPEVAGEAGLYFNPDDPRDIAHKISRLFNDPEQTRIRVEIGRERAKTFSDRKMAEETLVVLERAYYEAGAPSLKARASELPGAKPVLSCVVMPSGESSRAVGELAHLVTASAGRLQVILVEPPGEERRSVEPATYGIDRIPAGVDFTRSLEAALSRSRGEFIMLSDGRAIPWESFVDYMAVYRDSLRLAGDVLYGDPVYVDSAGTLWSPMLPGMTDLEKRVLCCGNFAFVVRKKALEELTATAGTDCPSLHSLAERLWDTRERRELFRPVSVTRKVDNGPAAMSAQKFTVLLRRYLAHRPAVSRALESPAFYRLARIGAAIYVLLPVAGRRRLFAAAKTLLLKTRGGAT